MLIPGHFYKTTDEDNCYLTMVGDPNKTTRSIKCSVDAFVVLVKEEGNWFKIISVDGEVGYIHYSSKEARTHPVEKIY